MAKKDKGKHIITSDIEHNSVLKPFRTLQTLGYDTTSVSVDQFGRVKPDDVLKAIRDDTVLISIMHANNEIGTIQPIKEIAQIAREKKITFHCDAVVQWVLSLSTFMTWGSICSALLLINLMALREWVAFIFVKERASTLYSMAVGRKIKDAGGLKT